MTDTDIDRLYVKFMEEFEDEMYTKEKPQRYFAALNKQLKIKPEESKYIYALITVNPKDTVNITDLLKLWDKATKKKWIKDTYSCIEWRKGDKGMHIHMMVTLLPKKKSHIHREMYSTFKVIVGNKKHVDVQVNKDCDKFIAYVDGYKKGVRKANHLIDCELRVKHNLMPILEFGI